MLIFFFQAEDGIRDTSVTGVQTCALPIFLMLGADGLDIHFIHVRSKHENALPVIVTHGWPGSVIEQLKIIGPLTDPTRSEERRVGKECRSRWATSPVNNKKRSPEHTRRVK